MSYTLVFENFLKNFALEVTVWVAKTGNKLKFHDVKLTGIKRLS